MITNNIITQKLPRIIGVVLLFVFCSLTYLALEQEVFADDPVVFNAKYYNNKEFSGEPVLERSESSIDYEWGNGSPDTSVNVDNFSAQWTADVNLEEGVYEFTVTADDGVRLFVDEEMIIDKWQLQPPTTYKAQKELSSGNHNIRMEYYENTVGATAKMNWVKLESQSVPEVSEGNFLASYYNNSTLDGEPVLIREESSVDYEWSSGSPDPVVSNDHFSAQWSTEITTQAGDYQFTLTADDGVRLYVDGELLINKWIDQPPTTYSEIINLSEGNHIIDLEYYEKTGGATVKLSWNKLEEQVTVPPPSEEFLAEYFNNSSLTGIPVLTRNEVNVDYDWGNGSPDSSVNTDNFSARWTGNFNFDETDYEFTVTADDGVRLYIDDTLIINKWIDQPPTTYKEVVNLSSGEHTIRLEYYEKYVGAVARLSWASTDSNPGETSPIQISSNSFSIVVLPDTQRYSEFYPEIFTSQTQWIADNKDELDIRFVIHEGDLVEDPTSSTEWNRAQTSMQIMDSILPYVLAVGNHEMPNGSGRDTSNFNSYFPYSKYSTLSHFGGVFESNKMDNAYYLITEDGIDFLILSLEFGPRDAVLDWANQVVESYPNRKVILVTHDYVYDDNTLHGSSSTHVFGPDDPVYGLEDYNTGVQIWEKLVRKHHNMFLTFSGHVHQDDGAGLVVDTGDNGNTVYQMFANYQHYTNGGNGYLRFLEINPVDKYIKVKTYSPYLDEYLTTTAQQFEFQNVDFEVIQPKPIINNVEALDKNTIVVEFNRSMDVTSSENISNYSISPTISIQSASLGGDSKAVTLTTEDLAIGDYTLAVNNVTDSQGNEIEANSTYDFSFTNTSSLSVRIDSSSDDAEEFSWGEMYLDSTDLEFVYEDHFDTDQIVGLRFNNLDIPPGASIVNAYLLFTADEVNSRETSIDIFGELVGHSSTFNTNSQHISNIPKTNSSVQWANIPTWGTRDESGANQTTPDLRPIVQEIVNLGDWQIGNSMSFILQGSGRRVAYSYEGSSSKAPLLYVEWEN